MQPSELAAYLNEFLCVRTVPDHPRALNGLQVDGCRTIRRVAGAVDACLHTVLQAVELNADLLVVHHGLFWTDPAPITGMLYGRLEPLLKHGVALYSCHLPLDIHPEVGNNARLCSLLGMRPTGTFGAFQGVPAGLVAETDATPAEILHVLDERLGTRTRWLEGRSQRIRKVGVLTGAGAADAAEALSAGCDALITGEGSHHDYLAAEETGVHVFLAGHYATETLGVRALLEHLESRLRLECCFIDHPTGL